MALLKGSCRAATRNFSALSIAQSIEQLGQDTFINADSSRLSIDIILCDV